MATAPISLNINNDWIPKTELTADKERHHRLQRLKRPTMTTDKNRQIGSRHIENQLTFISFVFIDRRVVGIKVSEDSTNDGNRRIGNRVELFIRQLFTSLVAFRDISELTSRLIDYLFSCFLNQFLTHSLLQ